MAVSIAQRAAAATVKAKPSEHGQFFRDGEHLVYLDRLSLTESKKGSGFFFIPETVVVESTGGVVPSDHVKPGEHAGQPVLSHREGERVTVGAWDLTDMMGAANAAKFLAVLEGVLADDLVARDSDDPATREKKERTLEQLYEKYTGRSQPARGQLLSVSTTRVTTKKGQVLVIPRLTKLEMSPQELADSRAMAEKRWGKY